MELGFIIVNSIAIVVIPIVAVLIAHRLQNRASKRKDKIDVFKTLVTYNAYGWGGNFRAVDALNSIPIIYSDDKAVIEQHGKYIQSCAIGNVQDMKTNKVKLLEVMSKSLDYKNGWEVFQNPYLPQGIIEEMENERLYKEGQVGFAQLFPFIKNMMPGNNMAQSSSSENETVQPQDKKGKGGGK